MSVELKNICKNYGSKSVLESFGITFPDSGMVALMGASGCGKTTLLRVIAGLEKPDRGEIHLQADAKVSMVFQEDRLLPGLSAIDNILAVLPAGDEYMHRARKMLDVCGLSQAAGKLPGELSGGMQRRVALARAIACDGDILLLDEPFKGLDQDTKAEAMRVVRSYTRSDALIILVTHDYQEAKAMADTIFHLEGPPLVVIRQESDQTLG